VSESPQGLLAVFQWTIEQGNYPTVFFRDAKSRSWMNLGSGPCTNYDHLTLHPQRMVFRCVLEDSSGKEIYRNWSLQVSEKIHQLKVPKTLKNPQIEDPAQRLQLEGDWLYWDRVSFHGESSLKTLSAEEIALSKKEISHSRGN
jgi:hypothetical protein